MRWWLKLILGLVVIALMLLFLWKIGSFTLKVLGTDGGQSGERDPMFAEEPEIVTQPPVIEESGTFQDNSANWEIPYHTPIDPDGVESSEQSVTP